MKWFKRPLTFIDVIIDPGLLGHHDGEVEHSPLAEDPVRIDPLVVDDLMDQHLYQLGCDSLEKLSPLPPLPAAPKYHRHFLSLHFFSLWTWNENDGISECQLCPGQVCLFVSGGCCSVQCCQAGHSREPLTLLSQISLLAFSKYTQTNIANFKQEFFYSS